VSRQPQSRVRPTAINLLLTSTSVLLLGCALFGAELALRFWSPGYLVRERGLHVYSPDYGWALRPSVSLVLEGAHTSVNAQGYRGRIVPPAEGERGRRAVVLGDSIAFGNGVGDGVPFAWQLDSRPNGLSVVNLAVPGYGMAQEMLKLEKEGLSHRPDVVVLCFCQANDFGTRLRRASCTTT